MAAVGGRGGRAGRGLKEAFKENFGVFKENFGMFKEDFGGLKGMNPIDRKIMKNGPKMEQERDGDRILCGLRRILGF